MFRPFLIHSCFNPTSDYQTWKTQRRPENCRCKFRVSRDEANYWMGEGVIQHMIVGWTLLGEKPSPTYSENVFCFTNRASKTPRVMTVEKANIERAYIDGQESEIERIEVWGELAQEVWTALIVPYRPDPFYGRTLLFSSTENRTSVGIDRAGVPSDDTEI
jgi:hypothetical protein